MSYSNLHSKLLFISRGKKKFASACVSACRQITPQFELLLPEITSNLSISPIYVIYFSVEKLIYDNEQTSRLFW